MSKRKTSAVRKEYNQPSYFEQEVKTFYKKHKNENVLEFKPHIAEQHYQHKKVELVPKTRNQERYILALNNESTDIVVVAGPAGTGKTYLAMLAAIRALKTRQCDKIILTRPAVSVDDEKHGFLPGDITQKMEPWTRPLIDVLREFYNQREVTAMLTDGTVEIAPLAFCRGRNFKNAWIVLDEAQNATPSQLKMIMTRIGEGSKIVITGDIEQTDRRSADNGLQDLETRLKQSPVEGIELCGFDLKDVQRHRIIPHVLNLYK